mmetsp:Transcript_36030/g.84132  ORF Transcript_36030/g.84132 Transcript_36030/m.84132 type:complete len:529 (-) Transcript_36030:61-1647(-)
MRLDSVSVRLPCLGICAVINNLMTKIKQKEMMVRSFKFLSSLVVAKAGFFSASAFPLSCSPSFALARTRRATGHSISHNDFYSYCRTPDKGRIFVLKPPLFSKLSACNKKIIEGTAIDRSISFSRPILKEIVFNSTLSNSCVQNDANGKSRRTFISVSCAFSSSLLMKIPAAASAEDVWDTSIRSKVNAAVTQSDLGVAVRRSIVRGAQRIDQADGEWEKFSDRFGLGTERSKRDARPKERNLPEPLPLDISVCLKILDAADRVFLSLVPFMNVEEFRSMLAETDETYRKSFERSSGFVYGDDLDQSSLAKTTESKVVSSWFNFICYVHFKTYVDILIKKKVDFKSFYNSFKQQLGEAVVTVLAQPENTSPQHLAFPSLRQNLESAFQSIDFALKRLRDMGFIVAWELNVPDPDQVSDWENNRSNLEFSLAIDGDVTLSSQVLMQEQGYRIYPNFCTVVIFAILQNAFSSPLSLLASEMSDNGWRRAGRGMQKQNIVTEDYYMDTSYSSDPDKFEVKQLLINIVVESA